MGKGTNFSRQPVLSQLIKLMDRSRINTLGAYIDLITLLNCQKLDWNLLEQQRARWVASQNIRQLELFPT